MLSSPFNKPVEDADAGIASQPSLERRGGIKAIALVVVTICIAAVGVHFATLHMERSALPLDDIVVSLETFCPRTRSSYSVRGRKLPPSAFGVVVWVDSEELLAPLHASLDVISARLLVGRAAPEGGDQAEGEPMLFRSVHLQRKTTEGLVYSSDPSSSSRMITHATMAAAASTQQLGLPTLKHTFPPNLRRELAMKAVSFFSLPTERLPSSTTACSTFQRGQAYCTFATTMVNHTHRSEEEEEGDGEDISGSSDSISHYTAAAAMAEEVEAAIASVLAQELGLRSFRAADVAQWHAQRSLEGCLYAVASVRALKQSVEANPDMTIPYSVHPVFALLERHVQSRAYVLAARAADDLQYHLLLTPQLYIPWDHAIVSQLVIFLPLISLTLLAARFIVAERRMAKARCATAATVEKVKAD